MICRLCLEETDNSLKICSNNIETEEAKIITKYFHIEVHVNDSISNRVCTECWRHIYEFHKFWLTIDGKQKTLHSHLACTQIKRDVEELEAEIISYPHKNSPPESKDVVWCEPEIDMVVGRSSICEDELEFDAADDMEDDEITMKQDSLLLTMLNPVDESKATGIEVKPKRKYTKRKVGTEAVAKQIFNKNLRSAKKDASSKEIENETVMANKAELAKKQSAKSSLIREMDDFIAKNTQLSCCLCAQALADFNALKKHFRQEHHCVGYVPCCNNRYRKRTLYVDHLKLHQDPDYFKCTLCNKQLASRDSYQNHMDKKHPDAENLRYSCQLCPRKFTKQYSLDCHIKSRHTKTRDYICKTCNKGFINAGVLKQHENAVHLNKYDSVCEICGKCFKTSQNLLTHMEAIHSTEPRPQVQCKNCQKWFKSASCLRKHMMAHRDKDSGQEFKCPKCGMEKSSRHALASHIRYHHSDKVYRCTICSKEFKHPHTLREHETTHTGTHLYTCSFCPKTFRSHGNMHKHKVNNHSNEWVRKHTQPNEITKSLLNLLPTDEGQS